MSVSSDSYDVIVVGGGPAGTSAAIHLATQGARVLLAEQKKFPRAKLCGEFISPECLDHFQRLGVMDSMIEAGGARLSETLFYARRGASVNVPSAWFGTQQAVALGLSRAEMDERLLRRASAASVFVLEDARATALLMEGDVVRGVRLKVCGQEVREYNARVTLDATGRARSLARYVKREAHNTTHKRAPLVAFKTHLEGARGNPLHCEIYFYRGGYGGLSSVEGGLSNLCFIVSANDVRARGGDADRVLREVVMTNARASHTLREARPATEWLGVALESFGRHEVVPAKGLLAVGDAASFIDPFTGSGMLMALESGELAAQSVARWLDARGQKPLSFDSLGSDYRALYLKRFNARLRICALLRRAAFVPGLAEAAILACGASTHLRRRLARATRRPPLKSLGGRGSAET
ncbi:MAG TPA: NAD(P)/FAD-dependent oxidoreductase [Pyrinomonadaceae bacterium]|jgi:flavin-dependent dehydrogenase|nr:NAD(P)/FAD-dependent oxidoreductase [Pyrinomonadaceae bacterium]